MIKLKKTEKMLRYDKELLWKLQLNNIAKSKSSKITKTSAKLQLIGNRHLNFELFYCQRTMKPIAETLLSLWCILHIVHDLLLEILQCCVNGWCFLIIFSAKLFFYNGCSWIITSECLKLYTKLCFISKVFSLVLKWVQNIREELQL